MNFNKNWAKKFKKDGYILFKNLINKKELNEISKRLKYLSKKQKGDVFKLSEFHVMLFYLSTFLSCLR